MTALIFIFYPALAVSIKIKYFTEERFLIYMTDLTQKIIEQILAVPKGKVSSYRDIAARAGLPNGARQTVRVLHTMSEKYNLPWYRIIRSNGTIALGEGTGKELQIKLLRREKVKVSEDGRIDINKYGY
ncbi:MAG: MGMT family protein [Treponema sp.]|jgi:methylated-DNA-protein-cysteine methyltransferase-like protein|nr:MGMT family protein [Treponema sp.]